MTIKQTAKEVIGKAKYGVLNNVDLDLVEQRIVELRYNPNQPRDPKGSDTGGQWTSDGKSSSAGYKTIKKWKVPSRANPSPDGTEADFSPEKGGILFHGTSIPDAVEYLEGDSEGVVYLTDDYKEAVGYAEGLHLGGGGKGTKRVLYVSVAPGEMVDISADIDEAVSNGEDFGPIFSRARDQGAEFAFYTHPSFDSGNDEQRVIVALNPGSTLGTNVHGWDIQNKRKWRRPRD